MIEDLGTWPDLTNRIHMLLCWITFISFESVFWINLCILRHQLISIYFSYNTGCCNNSRHSVSMNKYLRPSTSHFCSSLFRVTKFCQVKFWTQDHCSSHTRPS